LLPQFALRRAILSIPPPFWNKCNFCPLLATNHSR